MRAVVVVVHDVFEQDLLEMAPSEDEEPIRALSPDGSHESLGECVRPRGLNWSLDDSDALCSEHLIEAGGELRISVPDEELN